jgi:hypothetical protein
MIQAYYPFEAEKEILEMYGDEIARRMFGLPTTQSRRPHVGSRSSSGGGSSSDDQTTDEDDDEAHQEPYTPKDNMILLPSTASPIKEKWYVCTLTTQLSLTESGAAPASDIGIPLSSES